MNGLEIFEQLRRTAVYEATNEEVKREICGEVIDAVGDKLAVKFGPDGTCPGERGERVEGFGFLVEEFARRSRNLPKNTQAAQKLAEIILEALRGGHEELQLKRRLRNPDLLWIKFTGWRAEITGMGEVKASRLAASKKLVQLVFQEDAIRQALREIERQKAQDTATDYFTKRKITVASQFKKVLVVPQGAGESVKDLLKSGWECQEIEFSYGELEVIGKLLWPEFRPHQEVAESVIARFEREFMKPLAGWAEGVFSRAFPETGLSPFPAGELLLFTLATGKLPLLDEGVSAAVNGVNQARFTIPLEREYPADALSGAEKRMLKKFKLLLGEEAYANIMFFLHLFREFAPRLQAWLKKRSVQEKFRAIEGVEVLIDFDILDA